MRKTLDQITAAHPEMRHALHEAARNYSPGGFDDDGNLLFNEEGLLLAARVMSGDGQQHSSAKGVTRIEYR